MALWPQPSSTASINAGHALATSLTRCVLLNEGTGSPKELVGAGTGTLTGGATWSTHADIGNVIDLSSAAGAYVNYGANGLKHGPTNTAIALFFIGIAPTVAGATKYAGAIAGSTSDGYGWSVHSTGVFAFVLRNVVERVGTLTPVAGRTYTVGMSKPFGGSIRLSVYDQTSAVLLGRETIFDDQAPTQVAQNSVIGNIDNLTESWRSKLGTTYIWNRTVSDAEFDTLHANPYALINDRIQLRPNADVSAGTWTSTGANLFSVIDEVVTDDLDYIQSAVTPTNDVAEVALTDPSTTLAGTTTIVVRARK